MLSIWGIAFLNVGIYNCSFFTVLAASRKFWHVVSSFPFISKCLLIPCDFFLFYTLAIDKCVSNFHIFVNLWKIELFSVAFTPLYKENSLCMILSLLWLVSWCIIWPTLENVPLVNLRQMYILLVLDGVFYRYLLSLIHLWSLLFPSWSSI